MQVIDRLLFAILSAMSLALIFSIAMTAAHGETSLKARAWAESQSNSTTPHKIEIRYDEAKISSPNQVEFNAAFW